MDLHIPWILSAYCGYQEYIRILWISIVLVTLRATYLIMSVLSFTSTHLVYVTVAAQVSEKYIHVALIYTTDNTFTFLPIKHLVNQIGEPTTPHKLAIRTKTSVSNMCVLFCTCVVQKKTAHV